MNCDSPHGGVISPESPPVMRPGYVQANLVILPAQDAADFVAFCNANAQACPVLAVGEPGDWRLPTLGYDIDVRTDLPKYWVYRAGESTEGTTDISKLWQDDHVAVAIGCWFSMEDALARANVRMRHLERGIQGSLFRTTRDSVTVGRFGGPLVVVRCGLSRRAMSRPSGTHQPLQPR